MSEHRAKIAWQRRGADFTYQNYSRDHVWSFTNGIEISASAAPGYLGNAEAVDPEEAFVASLSSCHMLTFLALAARKRIVVESYVDEAVGVLSKNAQGKLAVTEVTLRPEIAFGENAPSRDELDHLHELAHGHCFIANSVLTKISVEMP